MEPGLARGGGERFARADLAFFSRERGLSEEVFLRQLAHAFGWPFVDLPSCRFSPEARQKISTKVAFQFFVLRSNMKTAPLQIAVSNPWTRRC